MKFKQKNTGAILETNNEFVINQLKKSTDYEPIEEKLTDEEPVLEPIDEEIEEKLTDEEKTSKKGKRL